MIKGYSPELIVHPYLPAGEDRDDTEKAREGPGLVWVARRWEWAAAGAMTMCG